MTLMDRRAEAEPQACRTEVEMGAWQTRANPVGVRTMMEPKGWMDEA